MITSCTEEHKSISHYSNFDDNNHVFLATPAWKVELSKHASQKVDTLYTSVENTNTKRSHRIPPLRGCKH